MIEPVTMRFRIPFMLVLLAAAARCLAVPPPSSAVAARLDSPARIEASLRASPERAAKALRALAAESSGELRIEALITAVVELVRIPDLEAMEQVARTLDAIARQEHSALAEAGALFARAVAIEHVGPAIRGAEPLDAARRRLPADAPDRIRMLFLSLEADNRQHINRGDEAVAFHQQAVEIADRLGIAWQSAELRAEYAYTLYRAHQTEQALPINHLALQFARSIGDPLASSRVLNIEGILQTDLGHYDLAHRDNLEAYRLARQANAKREELGGLANLSDHYLKIGDYRTALESARRALPLAAQTGEREAGAVALANAGLAELALGMTRAGMADMGKAIATEQQAGELGYVVEMQRDFGLALERAGQLRAAWAALSEYRRLAVDLENRERQQSMLALEESFAADRRALELRALRTDSELKHAELRAQQLRRRLLLLGFAVALLALAVATLLLLQLRRRNRALSVSNAQLARAGSTDPLTGLANRREFLDRMEAGGAAPGAFRGCLLLLDLDGFKAINDQRGHAVGDQVLVEVAGRLLAAIRPGDLCVRWGGEEFLVVVRTLPREQEAALVRRLLDAVGAQAVPTSQGELAVTASVGFASFPLQPADQEVPWTRAIALVDSAMYLAKARGGNQACGILGLQPGPGGSWPAEAGQLEAAWQGGRADLAVIPAQA